ncbi:hypothetical protein LLG95_14755 [bacterium]|nr:hypothetical protein [bacterium]
MNLNRVKTSFLLLLLLAFGASHAWATSDYSLDFVVIDLTGGNNAGQIYSGQSIWLSDMVGGTITSSSDYSFHPLLSKPNLTVSSGLILIPDGGGPISLGSTMQGAAPLQKTFTVYNNGSSNLVLGTPNCPAGYSVTEPLNTVVGSGTGDNFTVSLSTASSGTFSGTVSFTNNDIECQVFNFLVTGRILAPADMVWVDFNWTGSETGSEALPFNTLAEGVGFVNSGETIRIKAGSGSEHIRITKPMRIEAVGGTARIGAK